MNIELRMFGAFRALGEQISLSLPEKATVADMSAQLETRIAEYPTLLGLLPVTKFSTETEILTATSPLQIGETYAVLPPVSGG